MKKQNYKYIEVKGWNDKEVYKRLDVSKNNDHSINTIVNGMSRNMNHENFYVTSYESAVELDLI